MLSTPRQDFADRSRRLREHAMSVSAADRHASILAPAEEYLEIGFNYRMTDLQAAVGIVQLGRLHQAVQRRRELAANYAQAFAGIEGLRLVDDPGYGTGNFQSCWLEVGPAFPMGRDALMTRLAEDGISARRGIMAAHRQPAYAAANMGAVSLEATEWLTDHTLILPLYHQLSLGDQVRVIDSILRAAGQGR
jgi:dTDP-4-amino-4,6-dideoxygalactose transaminase